MGEFLGHEPCPNCGSRDNLGVWEDHKWCFGCGYYEGPKDRSLEQLRKLAGKFQLSDKDYNNKKGKNEHIFLPSDYTRSLPAVAIDWLKKYEITEREVISNHLCWSPSHERLYFPVYDVYGNLVLYQGRFFGTNTRAPRYSTRGFPDLTYHFIGRDTNSCVVLVEDIISAIKVGRFHLAMPLWGSQISTERLIKLGDRFKDLIIWLDRDKAKYSLKQRYKASIFFDRVANIITEKDPKEYTNGEIVNYLSKCF